MWNIKIIHWQKTSKRLDFMLFPTGKKARYMHAFLFYDFYQ